MRLLNATPLLLGLMVAGCVTAEDEFTQGRLEKTCDGAIPICTFQAACVLGRRDFLEGSFPGGQRFIIHTDDLDQRVVVRLLFTEMIYPGTEFMLQLYGPACSSREEKHVLDVDLFERAGDDQIVEFSLPINTPGDHMLEMFGDMAASYLLAIELER